MRYNFDEIVERHNTGSTKWDFLDKHFGVADALPMWVADMDFKAPEEVINALMKRAEHGVFGYSDRSDSYYEAVAGWMERRHGWKVEKEWLVYSPGIVPAVNWLIRALTHPGDKVVIQTPVYYPFFKAIENNGCHIVDNPLVFEDGMYRMNLEELEHKIDERTRLMILCSPHNPVGRVWERAELIKLGELCLKHGITVIADEIHSDLVFKEHKHTPFAAICEEFAMNSVICTAPSKTFNLAGLQISNMIIPNEKLREAYLIELDNNGISNPNSFGVVAAEAAYNYGWDWLEQLMEYLEGNLKYLTDFTVERLPKVKVIKPQGTYLVWMDFREMGLDMQELSRVILQEARVAVDDGFIFGKSGEGFVRLNIACPRSILEEGLNRIASALQRL